jgi:uracil-DNA glycosylase
MEKLERSLNAELANWLRYYRDLGFTHLYRHDARQAGKTDGQSSDQGSHQGSDQGNEMTRKNVVTARSDSPGTALPSAMGTSPYVPAVQQGGLFTPVRSQETLEQIREDLGDCRRCKLSQGRKTIVFGSGNPKAELVFVGEGPGADEDEQGLPFVGRAGQLLTDMIEKGLKIPRPDVYICNIVKCRPPGNRKPERDEVAACRQFVERQLDSIRPRVVCALGSTAAETLLDTRESMGRLRGKWYEFRGLPVMVTYHPAFLLRDPSRKTETWADLKMILARLNAPSSASNRE